MYVFIIFVMLFVCVYLVLLFDFLGLFWYGWVGGYWCWEGLEGIRE